MDENASYDSGSIKRRRLAGSMCSASSDVFSTELINCESQNHDSAESDPLFISRGLLGSDSTSGCSSLTEYDPNNTCPPDTNVTVSSNESPNLGGFNKETDDRPKFFLESVVESEGNEVNISPPLSYIGCPNVSLSPISQRQISRISSVSSGRNSFDEDTNPFLIADVLVVTHRGLMKELITYFLDELHCKISGGRKGVMRPCPNTAISKFTVALGEKDDLPTVTCLYLYDHDHLISSGADAKGVEPE